MTADFYEVHIKVADLEWTITPESEDGDLEDVRVLDSLSMDWAMPDGLWPVQPDPMRAAFALYVPDFQDSGVAGLQEGDDCQIQVKLHPDSDPVFAFYGRVSDLQANPATGRPGVMLSLAAVDYTVDLSEVPLSGASVVGVEILTTEHLGDIWTYGNLGDFPTWPTVVLTLGHSDPPVLPPEQLNTPALDTIRQDLLQTAWEEDEYRVILAPLIDPATGLPDTDQPWAFDKVYKPAQGTPLEVASCHVETESLEWVFNKDSGVTAVEVTGNDGTDNFTALAAHDTWPPVLGYRPPVQERISTTLGNESDAILLAEFYLPPEDVSRWKLETFRWRVGLLDEADLETFPPLFFPQWALTETDEDRSACYGAPVLLTDIPSHRTPLDGETVLGRLAGAALSVTGGRVFLDLQIRQAIGDTP